MAIAFDIKIDQRNRLRSVAIVESWSGSGAKHPNALAHRSIITLSAGEIDRLFKTLAGYVEWVDGRVQLTTGD